MAVKMTLAILALAVAAVAMPVRAGLSEIVGEARDPDSDALLYVEQHLLRTDNTVPLERLVMYRCPDGRAFARKSVDYALSTQAPQFSLDDARFGYREGFVGGEGYAQRGAAEPERRAAIDRDAALVVDAGFDWFVRANWERLLADETVRLQFLVPSRLDSYGFRLRRVGRSELFGEPAQVFRLALSGWLGWLADPIEVSYRERDRRLMRFVGMSNIRRDPDDNFVARIEFPPSRERSVDEAPWQAAIDEPLVDCPPGR